MIQAMSTRTQILVLGLAVGLLHGCAHFPMTLVRSVPPPVNPTHENQADNSSFQPPPAVEYEATAAVLAQQLDVQEEDLLAPPTLDSSSTSAREAAPKPDQQEANKRTASVQNDSAVLRNGSGPRVEDRFLNSLEKDLNKGIDQPVEQR